ncbi:MAG: thiolase domain-containing protein [Anaerolineae bacterium]|nr:thiolase domain-containing protein [Anaerolineae bacterium]
MKTQTHHDVVIAGIGQVPVGEHWEISLRSLATRAMRQAMHDAGDLAPQALYIGNMLAPVVSHQSNLGALLSDNSGLEGIEAFTVEAADASGAGALRVGYMAVASGFVDYALVVGVEKVTDRVGPGLESAIAESLDYDFEAVQGINPAGVAALVAQRYLYEYHVPRSALATFPLLAHAHAVNNPFAMYRKAIRREVYESAGVLCDPLCIFDGAPYADGAAAVLLTRADLAPEEKRGQLVKISGSNITTDTLALHDRADLLAFQAMRISTEQACRQAGILPQDVDFFELCDSFSIYAPLALEAAGFAARGEGCKLAENDALALTGKLPILTMGGGKARGYALGAAGLYQVVEAVLQLRGQAGLNQVKNARRALVQSLGGAASTVVTHVLEKA